MVPHCAFAPAHVVGTQGVHTWAMESHASSRPQTSQLSVAPQPSGIAPHAAPHVIGSHAPQVPDAALQTSPLGQPPQSTGWSHASSATPQLKPVAPHVSATVWQVLVVRSQRSAPEQTPHRSTPPQPSGMVPQFAPVSSHRLGAQAMPLPPSPAMPPPSPDAPPAVVPPPPFAALPALPAPPPLAALPPAPALASLSPLSPSPSAEVPAPPSLAALRSPAHAATRTSAIAK
jgi:hypothetical protein